MAIKKNKNLSLKVYNRIIELMLNYEIVPGQRLVFVDLAKQLQVSRTPVNNALGMLAQEGYLDFVPNQGYSVHKMTQKEAEDLYEIREVLEVGFISQAIRNMTDQGLQKVEKQKIAYENAISNQVTRKMFILDTEFHVAIMEMTGNELFVRRYRDLSQKIFLRFRTDDLIMSRIEAIRNEHHELYEAIRLKDVELAKERIRAHYRNSKQSLFPIIFAKE
ncbi:GntR family transcriptional regulator [Desulfopila aestuarii]|uniref:DNA-binding transcriptional regulator, GntR family n=1 Tax=Desulfopila aestuarii DSM 18488 TaxID=1121416 RepID=A0A1M7XY59_9BACT|nr:GntR family transcriptional regulator [Desulfopila aestuarii]SHO43921.1 DNA-binding transcriptional regulator, GntR family [Desulfopila aestuarii DSM 18488]